MSTSAGRTIVTAVKHYTRRDTELIRPQLNFEIDLGLDSLARAECFAGVEQSLGIELEPEKLAAAQTVGELIVLANAKLQGGSGRSVSAGAEFSWHDELAETTEELPEIAQLVRPKPGLALIAYVVLRLIYFVARLVFRMEVEGSERLTDLKPPYLICPNHQSYVDPFLVCSTYPPRVLQDCFHVGASMYFTDALMAQLARLINVVPVDPDAQLLRAMRAGAAGLRAGKILNIYPEGQRSFDGKLLDFKKGAAILATELNVPIVPVALDGAYRIWPRKSWRFRLAKVKIKFGEPIDAKRAISNEANDEVGYEKVTMILKQQIQQMLDEMRKPETSA
jgi:long-chain acyl-CoA synthetase